MPLMTCLRALSGCLLVALLLCGGAAFAAPVGEVLYVQGAAAAQSPVSGTRILAAGSALEEGDTISTADASFAIIELADGTRTTLRPNTTFKVEKFSAELGSALMRLLKGGLRTVTGAIAKRNPNSYRIETLTATIGVRGTSFDARICADDCAREIRNPPRAVNSPVAARVVSATATLAATAPGQQTRTLEIGAPIYAGDVLETSASGYAVIAFRDEGRITLNAGARMEVRSFKYSANQAQDSSIALKLVKGAVRILTGLIAKRNPDSFRLETRTATIGIRGTGFDVVCDGACADPANPVTASAMPGDGLYVHVWQSQISVTAAGGTLMLNEGDSGVLTNDADTAVILSQVPSFLIDNPAPRPDTVPVDQERLFGEKSAGRASPGLYVGVREGHVQLALGDQLLDLGGGEYGHAGDNGSLSRLQEVPEFLERDPTPLPEQFDSARRRLLDAVPDECVVRWPSAQ